MLFEIVLIQVYAPFRIPRTRGDRPRSVISLVSEAKLQLLGRL